MAKAKKRGFFQPEQFLTTIELVDSQNLVARGFKAVLLDVDNTVVPRDTHEIPESVQQWIDDAQACGLTICLLSNNWHKTVFTYADQLGLPCVYKAMKPLPFAFLRALHHIGMTADDAVVIGDQLMTDVLGAHFLGIPAIMVRPRASQDLWHTLLLRRVERRLMKDRQPER